MRSQKCTAQFKRLIPVALGLLVVSAVSGCLVAYDETRQVNEVSPDDAERLIGAYALEPSERPGTPPGIGTRLKFFIGTHWMITEPDPETGQVVYHHGGRYVLNFDTIIEPRTHPR